MLALAFDPAGLRMRRTSPEQPEEGVEGDGDRDRVTVPFAGAFRPRRFVACALIDPPRG